MLRRRMVWAADGSSSGDGGAAGTAAGSAAGGAGAPGAGAGGGAAAPAFAETLPEDIRGEAVFRDIKDLGALAKGYLHATKMIGGRPEDLIRMPGPDDEAGWNAAWDKLGRPKDAKGYAFTAPTLPEGVTVDEALQGGFAEAAHKAGLTAKQADALFAWYNGEVGNRFTAGQQAQAQAEEAAIAGLRQEWGAAFDQKVELGKAALAHYGDAEFSQYLDTSRLGNHPSLLRLMAKLGTQLSEDGVIGKGGEGGSALKSPAEARQEIAALQADPTFRKTYMDRNAPGHKDAVTRMQGLYAMAYPPPPAA